MLLTIDARKRIPLGRLLLDNNVSMFDASVVDGKIILEPMRAVPAREAWLYKNTEALASVIEGIKQSKDGRIKKYIPFK